MIEVRREGRPSIEQTALDRMIAWWDPIRGAERLRARAVMAYVGGTAYDGASRSKRSMSAWKVPAESADSALMPDLPVLRDRSRDLQRNNPLAAGAVNTVVTRVVGTGLAMQPAIDLEVLGVTEDQAAAWQAQVKRRWRMWAETPWCDVARRLNFYQLQSLALRSALEAGDTFALLPILADRERPNELAIKLIEADRITNPRLERDRPEQTGGIRMDPDGRPVAYHILRQHPGSIQRVTFDGDWVDAYGANSGRRNVLHVLDPRRIGQTRGEPYLAAVIEPLKQLGRYTNAEVEAAVAAGFFAVFITHPAGEGLDPLVSAATGQAQSSDVRQADWKGELTAGLAVDLAPGADVTSASPGRPNRAFDPFVLAVLRQIGAALEIPFELLIKHFTSSFTAARAALLDFWLFVRRRRDWMETMFCQPIYEEWLRLEIMTGRIAASGYFADPLVRAAWSAAEWTGDAMGVLDPQRELAAIGDALDRGLTNLERECMLFNGSTWQDNHAQQVREQQARKKDGLLREPKAAPGPAPAEPAPGNGDQPLDDDNEDDSDAED